MIISGLQKVTLLDYPQHIACTVFLGHCNLRCPFCHNMQLVLEPEKCEMLSIEDILNYLKELGYKIKIDTNGFFPDMIEKLINDKLVDYFAMDIKAGFTNYAKVINSNFDDEDKKKIQKSIDLLMNKSLDYEFRTTCVKGLHDENDFIEIDENQDDLKNQSNK